VKTVHSIFRFWRRFLKAIAENETTVVLCAIFLFIPLALVAIWLVPQWQVGGIPEAVLDRHTARYFEIENEARRTIAQVLLGVFSAFAIFLAWRRARAADGTLKIAQEGHVTDRLTKAIEQLSCSQEGQPVVEVRVGAIYALERLSIDSPRDYWSVVDILAAYLCQHAKLKNLQATELQTYIDTDSIRADLRAALIVLGRRRDPAPRFGLRLQLTNCFLPSTSITGDYERTQMINCDFSRCGVMIADFSGSSLTRVDFRGSELSKVKFDRSHLSFLSYQGARIRESSFSGATLGHVDFRGAVCDSVDFRGATFKLVNICGADLTGAFGLTVDILEEAVGDDTTMLPSGLARPANWSVPDPAKRAVAEFHPPLDPRQMKS